MRLVGSLVFVASIACGGEAPPIAGGPDASVVVVVHPDAEPVACASGTVRGADGACETPGISACPTVFGADPSGLGCAEISPASCPPGTRARVGQSECQPAGWAICPLGFVRDDLGFGCADVTPASACAGASFEKIGDAACAPLPGCDAPFPPPDATFFVDARFAQVDATHFRTITDALAAAPDGATIAVDTSTYAESITIDRRLHLAGRCAREASLQGAIRIRGDVTLTGLRFQGLVVEAGARAIGRGLQIEGATGEGILVRGARVDLENTVIRSTNARPDGTSGRGIALEPGSQVALQNVSLANNREAGIDVEGSAIRLDDVVVRATQLDGSRASAAGVQGRQGAQITLNRVASFANLRAGLRLTDGARATATSLVVRDTAGGAGIVVRDGAGLSGTSLTLDRNKDYALAVLDSGTATLTAAAIQRTRRANPLAGTVAIAVAADNGSVRLESSALLANSDRGLLSTAGHATAIDTLIDGTEGALAPGVGITQLGHVRLTGVTVTNSGGAALIVQSGTAELSESIVATTRAFTGAQVGAGLVVNTGTATIDGCVVKDNASFGIIFGNVRGGRARGTISRSLVARTFGRDGRTEDQQEGFGVWVSEGSTLALSLSDLDQNENGALGVHHGAHVTVERSLFRRTKPNKLGSYGNGIYSEGVLELSDSALVGNTTIGLQAHGPTAHVTVDRVLIDATRPKSDGVFGHGVAASFESTLIMRDSEIRGSAGAGFIVQDGAAILASSLLTQNVIGIHVQDGTALTQVASEPSAPQPKTVLITEDTRFIDNGTRTGVGVVPIPDPLSGPGS